MKSIALVKRKSRNKREKKDMRTRKYGLINSYFTRKILSIDKNKKVYFFDVVNLFELLLLILIFLFFSQNFSPYL